MAKLRELSDKAGPMPTGMLATPLTGSVFRPELCSSEFLKGFVEGVYDSLNDDPEIILEERALARAELVKRG
jgi:hypothetical protein